MKTIPTLFLSAILTIAAAAPAMADSERHHSGSPDRGRRFSPREHKEYRAQLRLRQLGYYHGTVDGQIGPRTQRAIARFQRDQRLRVTAWLDVHTLRALGVI